MRSEVELGFDNNNICVDFLTLVLFFYVYPDWVGGKNATAYDGEILAGAREIAMIGPDTPPPRAPDASDDLAIGNDAGDVAVVNGPPSE